ncbi:chemotaxis protein CheW [Methanospirillum stamsii]|uniref:Chemotaxis protein CheW n=1 Tax=Methanospirillum stamsii TaxID=1277351 RepID=A0A2V2NB36_9EURY|nr:chemotaxis protein CheW [Methanospirillum stamsii]PWR72503.1 chemotaxis protein CheW [Methanospirillum stamsii]
MGDLAVENTGKAYSGINEIQDEIQVVEFILGDDIFAINLFDVKEIVEYTRITPLPGREQFIKGIIDLRGEITTIIDLKEKMGITANKEINEQARIIVIDNSVTKSKTGILVDDVTTVMSVHSSQIDQKTCDTDTSSYILGIIKQKQLDRDSDQTYLIIWLDIPGMLKDIGL